MKISRKAHCGLAFWMFLSSLGSAQEAAQKIPRGPKKHLSVSLKQPDIGEMCLAGGGLFLAAMMQAYAIRSGLSKTFGAAGGKMASRCLTGAGLAAFVASITDFHIEDGHVRGPFEGLKKGRAADLHKTAAFRLLQTHLEAGLEGEEREEARRKSDAIARDLMSYSGADLEKYYRALIEKYETSPERIPATYEFLKVVSEEARRIRGHRRSQGKKHQESIHESPSH